VLGSASADGDSAGVIPKKGSEVEQAMEMSRNPISSGMIRFLLLRDIIPPVYLWSSVVKAMNIEIDFFESLLYVLKRKLRGWIDPRSLSEKMLFQR